MNADHPANALARAHRKSFPAQNDFDIQALSAMPPYWGFVEGHADNDVSFRMFLGGNDDGVGLRLFWNGHYERATLKLWSHFARRCRLVLDIGAHTGIYTLAAHAANPAISVLSFEPHLQNYTRLTLNLRANGLATKDAYPIGVGAANETRPFNVPTHFDYLSSGGTFEEKAGGVDIETRVVSMDSFLPDGISGQVGLVKLDVEGHEAACLSGMHRLIETNRPVVIFECIHRRTAAAIHEQMDALGYRYFEINDGTGVIRETARLSPILNDDGSPVSTRLNRIATSRDEDANIILAAGTKRQAE